MTVHCIQIVTAADWPIESAETAFSTYRANHTEVLSEFAIDIVERALTEDGSGTDHYMGLLRFADSEAKPGLITAAEARFGAAGWTLFRHHDCDHDEAVRTGCSWGDRSTQGPVPADIEGAYP